MTDTPTPPAEAVIWPVGHPVLHIIAQAQWHDPAWIVGNRAGLTALRDALALALDGTPGAATVTKTFAADGEGYCVVIREASDAQMDEAPFGYTGEVAATEPGPFPAWMMEGVSYE